MSWSDELEIEDDTTWLIREWRIRDVANDNLMTSIQKIRLYEPKEITGEQITYTQE
ncbi:MAG: hypothetical protein R3350_03645 [Saprospiraceae bacterium]|nr:hypothetical protein [Saprospiraceae bacterium]